MVKFFTCLFIRLLYCLSSNRVHFFKNCGEKAKSMSISNVFVGVLVVLRKKIKYTFPHIFLQLYSVGRQKQ